MTAKSGGEKELRLDSDDFASGRFKAHGRSEVWKEDQIVRVDTVGPFNVEAIAAVNKTRARLFEANPPQSAYAYINTFAVSAMMSTDALKEYEAGLRFAYLGRFKPPSAMAWVFPEGIEGGTIMKPHYEKIFAAVAIPFQIFRDIRAAEIWVQKLLAAGMSE